MVIYTLMESCISRFLTPEWTIVLKGLAWVSPDLHSAICASCNHLPSIYGVVFRPSDHLIMNFWRRVGLQDCSLK